MYTQSKKYLDQAKKLGYPLQLDKTVAMNLAYKEAQRIIDSASLVLPAASTQYQLDKISPKSILSIEQVPEFLVKLGDKAKNPYS